MSIELYQINFSETFIMPFPPSLFHKKSLWKNKKNRNVLSSVSGGHLHVEISYTLTVCVKNRHTMYFSTFLKLLKLLNSICWNKNIKYLPDNSTNSFRAPVVGWAVPTPDENIQAFCHASICSLVLGLVTTKIWSDRH